MKKIENKNIIYSIALILYTILNIFLLTFHEPWRDEIHVWLITKNLSLPELFMAVNYDGHPILWYLVIYPFSKLGFPLITLNLVSIGILIFSAYVFLFKVKLPTWFKMLCLFTIPFTYTYSVISRNYSLIVLLCMLIAAYYPKRYDKPILYSILITLLIHTHTLVWGLVAGLTITFHFIEIYKHYKEKNNTDIKGIIFGLILIAVNTIIVVLQLANSPNTDVVHKINDYIIYVIIIYIIVGATLFLDAISYKKSWKEFLIIFCTFAFQIFVYTCIYSSVIYQRLIMIFLFILFYILLISTNKQVDNKRIKKLCIYFCVLTSMFAFLPFIANVNADIKQPYSSGEEMAVFINENIPDNTEILIDSAVIGQSILPYTEENVTFYDIAYDRPFKDCSYTSNNKELRNKALKDLSKYSGKYLIICNNLIVPNSNEATLIYQTQESLSEENYSLYKIN